MSQTQQPWQVVWITGASTGIGREVAIQLATAGAKVAASARSQTALNALAAAHANILAVPLDVGDHDAVIAAARQIERELGAIDLAIFNAGQWQPMKVETFSAAKIRDAMAVNYLGVASGIEAVLPQMRARRHGHIAMVASVAGYRGMPNGLAYNPTKAALISLAEALEPDAARHGIAITVINPGFVDTPMTQVNQFPQPFMVSADHAARCIVRGLARKKFEIVFPARMMVTMKLIKALPNALYLRVARRFMMPKPKPRADN